MFENMSIKRKQMEKKDHMVSVYASNTIQHVNLIAVGALLGGI